MSPRTLCLPPGGRTELDYPRFPSLLTANNKATFFLERDVMPRTHPTLSTEPRTMVHKEVPMKTLFVLYTLEAVHVLSSQEDS